MSRLLLAAYFSSALALSAAESPPVGTAARCAAELSARQLAATSIVARLRVILTELKTGKETTLRGAYISDAAGNMRLRVTAETGQLLLDFGARGDALEICVPDKARFYRGAREELQGLPQAVLLPLARCTKARELFFPTVNSESGAIVPERPLQRFALDGRAYFNAPASGGLTRRMSVDARQARVESIEWFKRGGGSSGRMEYSGYQDRAYPGRIRIVPPGSLFHLTLEVEELSLNVPLAPEKFTVPVPAGCKCETLSGALNANGEFWKRR